MKLLTLLFSVAIGVAASGAAEAQLVLNPDLNFTPQVPANLQERANSLGCSTASFHALPNEFAALGVLKGWIDCDGGRLYGGHRYFYNGSGWDGPYPFTAHIYGGIYYRFLQGGGDAVLGVPLTDEQDGGDGWGRYNIFHNGYTQTAIYYTPDTGPQLMYGGILARYLSEGAQNTWLRYPMSEEQDGPGGLRYVRFQGGAISWSPTDGTQIKFLNYDEPFNATILSLKGAYTGPDALNSAVNAALNIILGNYTGDNHEWGILIYSYTDGSVGLSRAVRGTGEFEVKYDSIKIPEGARVIADAHLHPTQAEPGPSEHDIDRTMPPQGWVIDAATGQRWYYRHKDRLKIKVPSPQGDENPAHRMPGTRVPPAPELKMGAPMWLNAMPEGTSAETIIQLGVEGAVQVFLDGGGILEVDEKQGQSLHPGGVNGGGMIGWFPKFW